MTKIKVEVFASAFTKMKGIQILGSFFCVFKWWFGGGDGGAVSAAAGERCWRRGSDVGGDGGAVILVEIL